ncbi:MAG: hypothetical protein F4X82_02500 [Candidatus Spechtbacteria bacterium SB0662_bin_43]|uniref:Uncharacterized protein n=1 Tax=Candidatus Spechtbacteria bacterium SB0662_bin_43 TaxID=2604897 RepID=A0A845DA77_9BACT|nr:hypothetical protein [Candidatus Spechtbacteria bacterium SB0662_bin_43]
MFTGTSQTFIAIRSIQNGVVELKGTGGKRSVLHVSSLNFALKSNEEQNAIIFEYQNFLNSLDFSLQIAITSRLANIEAYLESLQKAFYLQQNELLKIQTKEYINFINSFTIQNEIITTDFFVVVPLIVPKKGKKAKDYHSHYSYSAMMQRVNFVRSGLHRLGLRVKLLNTESLIALYWSCYNNKDMKKQSLLRSIFEE